MENTRIYFAPYHAMSGDSSGSPCGSIVSTFQNAVKRKEWPYDNGDDPSFYAMHRFGGQLSWGICRQDVRNRLSPGDMVVFFSYRRFEDTGDSEYRLCALATVERGVEQTELWQDEKLRKYTRYFNLLIRPRGSSRGAWEHFEPALEGTRLHKDWLWRIAEHRGLRKRHFERLEASNHLNTGATVRGRPIVIAANYVLFSADPSETHVLAKPPVVAWHSKGKFAEEWKPDRFSQSVRALTLEVAARASGRKRSLRIRNSQRAHRQVVFELPQAEAQSWRTKFLKRMAGR